MLRRPQIIPSSLEIGCGHEKMMAKNPKFAPTLQYYQRRNGKMVNPFLKLKQMNASRKY